LPGSWNDTKCFEIQGVAVLVWKQRLLCILWGGGHTGNVKKYTDTCEHAHTKALPSFTNIIAAKMNPPPTRYVDVERASSISSGVLLLSTLLVHLSGHNIASFLLSLSCTNYVLESTVKLV
jgi:hypothetical protein